MGTTIYWIQRITIEAISWKRKLLEESGLFAPLPHLKIREVTCDLALPDKTIKDFSTGKEYLSNSEGLLLYSRVKLQNLIMRWVLGLILNLFMWILLGTHFHLENGVKFT